MKSKLFYYAQVAVLAIVFTVGIFGFILDGSPSFTSLTPYNLLLGLFILLINSKIDLKFMAYFLLVFCGGMFIEGLGVHTAWLFGSYYYTPVLGPSVLEVPWMIGVNWWVLSFGFASIAHGFKLDGWKAALFIAAGMCAMDVLIEPVAIRYQFWVWENNVVPFYNYVCWFVFAFFFGFVAQILGFEKQNRMAPALLICQAVFFLSICTWIAFGSK